MAKKAFLSHLGGHHLDLLEFMSAMEGCSKSATIRAAIVHLAKIRGYLAQDAKPEDFIRK